MADPRHRIAPGRFGYAEKTDLGILPQGLMPSWLRQIVDPELQRIIEAGGQFASWIENKVSPGLQESLMRYETDPATGRTVATGTYGIEEPFKDIEFADATWYGKADLVVNRGGNEVQIGDFKVKKRWNPQDIRDDADKYLPQLSSYYHLHKRKHPSIGVADEVATIYVSQETAKFLRAAFDANAINSKQLLDELTSTGTQTEWRTKTEEFEEFRKQYSGDTSRQVLVHQAKVMQEDELRPYVKAEVEFSKAVDAVTGYSRPELGRVTRKYGEYATPTSEDIPFWTEWYEGLSWLASRYAAGHVTIGQVERGMAQIQERHGYGGARRFDDILNESLSKKPAEGEERVVERYNLNDDLRKWKPISDVIPGIPADTPGMENVRVNPETREIAITYDDGSEFLSEYWRGQYDILAGGKVALDGRLIAPRQIDSPNPLVPSHRWETAADVLPRILRTASTLVPATGGGSKAAKRVRDYMLKALEPMPSVGSDLLSVSAARMAYQSSMIGVLSDQYTAGQIEASLKAKGGTYAWRGQGRQAFDVAEYSNIPGWSYNPATGVLYAGATPGKIEKRARQGLRHELIFPVTRGASIPSETGARKYTTTFDTSRMMFSPIVQRNKRGERSEYGAELGYRAKAVVLGHSDVLPQGMAYTSEGDLGGVINRTIEFPGIADFTPLESIVKVGDDDMVIGYLNDDERTPVTLPLGGLDDFDLRNVKLTRSGHKTRLDVSGIGVVKSSSNLAKGWLGEKVMQAEADLSRMIGDPIAKGADILLPRRKNIRQYAFQLVSAAYAGRPIELAKEVYGDDWKDNLAVGLTEREKALEQEYGVKHTGVSMLMPIEEKHQKALYRVAIAEAIKGLRENVGVRTPLADTTRLMLESAEIPLRRMSADESGGGDRPWYEIGVPGVYSELFMQSGIERTGDPQLSFEEIMNLVQDPSGYGEGYQMAIMKKVLPQIAKWSGHTRGVYHDILKARMLSLRETGTVPSDDEVVTLEQLKNQLGDTNRSNFAKKLQEATNLHGKSIRIGNMYLPPAETLAALSVVEDFKKNMPWLDEEEGKELGIQAEEIGTLLSSLRNMMIKGGSNEYMALRESFLGTGVGGERLGVGMTQKMARGVMAAKLLRGGVERPVVSYDFLEDNQVLIGDDDLRNMFGPKFDLDKLNEALAVAGLVKRPITSVGRGGILAAQITTASQAREQGFDVPKDFSGIATSRYIINQLSSDFDADRILALLMSSIASSGEEFETDPMVQRAAELASLYSREARDLATQMGFKNASEALNREVDENNLSPQDIFDLNLMYGPSYSEFAKSHKDLWKEERILRDLANKGLSAVYSIVGTEDEWILRAPIKEAVNTMLGSTHSQEEMERAYNRLIRDVPAYMALTGVDPKSEEGNLQRLVAFRAYQQAVDKTLFSSGIREWMNLAEGYNPYRLQGRSYIKRLGPATPKGELRGEHLELISDKGGFSVRAIQAVLESDEYWGPMRTEEEEAFRKEKGIRAWAGEDRPELVARQKAMAITSSKDMQDKIAASLTGEEPASAQQIWELFGESGPERFANLWRDPGILAGPLGALVFAGMRYSAGRPVQPWMREKGVAQQHERNMLDWSKVISTAPSVIGLAETGKSMRSVSKGLSGKGMPGDIVENLRALSESGMYGATSILEALGTQQIIGRFDPTLGEQDDQLRAIQPTQDELLAVADAAKLGPEGYKLVGRFIDTISGMSAADKATILGRVKSISEESPEQLGRAIQSAVGGSKVRTEEIQSYAKHVLQLQPMSAQTTPTIPPTGPMEAVQQTIGGGLGGQQIRDIAFSMLRMADAMDPEGGKKRQEYSEFRSWVTGEGWKEEERGFPALAGLPIQEQREQMLGRVARGGLGTDMAQVIMATRPELMTKGMPSALSRASGLAKAGMLPGTTEYEQAMRGIMELSGMDAFPEELQNSAEELKHFQDIVAETTPALEEFDVRISEILETARTQRLTPSEIQELKRAGGLATVAARAGAGLAARGETEEQRALGREARGRAAAVGRQIEIADAMQQLLPPNLLQRLQSSTLGSKGPAAGADDLLRGIFSGWEMMRLQRQWGMTGGWAMQQVPIAAQQEMAAAQAAAAGMPMGQFQPGGIGMQIMGYQAGQQAFKGQVGRATFGAWGGLQQGITGEGLAGLLGVGAPAAGIGLIGGSLASMLSGGALSATAIGLPLALGALLLGSSKQQQAITGNRERMAIALAGGGTGQERALAAEQYADITPMEAAWLPPSQVPLTAEGRREQIRGERMMTGSLAGLTPLEQIAATEAAIAESRPEWMDPTQAGQQLAAWRKFTPGATNVRDILQDPRFAQISMRGLAPEQMAQTAMQWNMAPQQWQEVMDQMLSVSEGAATQAEWIAGQWKALTQFGVSPEEVRDMAYGGRQRLQRVAGGWEVTQDRQLEQLSGMQQGQLGTLGNLAEQLRIAGFAAPTAPTTTAEIAEQWQQIPLFQTQLGLQRQLVGMGAGTMQATEGTQIFGDDRGAMLQFQRFLQGNQWTMGQLGATNLPATSAMGMGFDVQRWGGLRDQFEDALAAAGVPDAAGMLDMLRPIVDPRTGLKVGIASFPDFGRQLAEGMRTGAVDLPAAVPDWVQEIVETRGERGLQVEQIGIQRGYQEWQWGQRERALDWQRVSQFGGEFDGFSTRGSFAIQKELRNLSRIWEDFTTGYNEQQRQLQLSQFMENWQVRAERMPIGFQWQREDLAFQGAQRTMQYGWGMEDIEEALRYATGRERRKLLRQQERATISYGMGMGQLGVQGERIDIREQWAEEDLERERRHFLERFALQDQYQARYRWYIEQRRALEDELQAIREFGARFNLEQAELALAKQQEIQAQLNAIQNGHLAIGQIQQNNLAIATLVAQKTAEALANQLAAAQAQARAAREAISTYSSVTHYGPEEY